MSTELAPQVTAERGEIEERSVSDVLAQVNKIQAIVKAVMHKDEHYGIIPGCKKPSLYKPGAEKLGFVFRLVPRFVIERTDYDNGHREYMVTCELYNAANQTFAGSGLGCCSTMEAKYRYRSGPKEFTGQAVPQDYWTQRKTDPAGALKSIGGPGHATAKNPDTGQWEVCIQGERVEYEDPADYYNTALKIAKKRSHTDAILTTTAASDIFSQDLDDDAVQAILEKESTRATAPTEASIQQPQRRSVKSAAKPTEPAQEKMDPRLELLGLCVEMADAGMTVTTTDHQQFSLILGDDTPDQICQHLSSFVGSGGRIVPGKTPTNLSDKAVYMTLKKAREVHKGLADDTNQVPPAGSDEEDVGQILDEAIND